jgi:hypothetical protein
MQHKIDRHAMGSRLSAVCANLLDDSVPPPACLVPGGYDLIFSKLVFHHIGDCASMVPPPPPPPPHFASLVAALSESGAWSWRVHCV